MEIQNRLNDLRSNIRKQQLANIMQKARTDSLKEDEAAVVRKLAETPPQQLAIEDLKIILELVNADFTPAIILMGNLVIDRFLGKQELRQAEWKVGNSEYWPWAIHAFTEVGFCTGEMFEHCVRRIIVKRSVFSLEHALHVLILSFKLNPNSIEHLRNNQELVLALANHAVDGTDRVPQLVLSIFSSLTSDDQNMPAHILHCLGVARTEEVLLQGLLKVQPGLRALSCQIANNFLLSGIWLQRVRVRLLELAMGEKAKVKVEISYYLKALTENAPEDDLLFCVKRHKLLQIMRSYSQMPTQEHPAQQIADNATKAYTAMRERFNASSVLSGDRAIQQAMEKMVDFGEVQTIYEDESIRMIE